jgi:hypothetical protein
MTFLSAAITPEVASRGTRRTGTLRVRLLMLGGFVEVDTLESRNWEHRSKIILDFRILSNGVSIES